MIAWNRAIEKMTDVKSEQMLEKGDYEYALPFMVKKRPMLINVPSALTRISIEHMIM